MRIRNISSKEIEAFAQLGDSEVKFKNNLLTWIKDGMTNYEWCFVIEEDQKKFQGRIIYGVLDNKLIILDINVENADEKLLYELLRVSLEEMKLKGFDRVECHIYSDKVKFQKYVKTLIRAGFKITQEKKSFIWNKDNIPNKSSKRLIYKSLEEMDIEEYIDAIEKVSEETLDSYDIEYIRELGRKEAAKRLFGVLKEIDFNQNWWKLAYTPHQELVGLVIPQKLNEDVGVINYIGVIPKKRGNGYVKDLIIEAVRTLSENNIRKVIADIDVKNYPLEKALLSEGFKLDCSMLVLKLN